MRRYCVITNEKDIVVSISVIPGINEIPEGYSIYFPAKSDAILDQFYKE